MNRTHTSCLCILVSLVGSVGACKTADGSSEASHPDSHSNAEQTTVEGGSMAPAPAFAYVPTTGIIEDGAPARADTARPSEFVLCEGTFALCYYSGPPANDETAPDLSCTVTAGPHKMANCNCLRLENQSYQVDISGILERATYEATVKYCQQPGVDCIGTANVAPVCTQINQGELFAGAASISAFSSALSERGTAYQIHPTSCTAAKYAGCMTAPCVATDATTTIEGVSYKIDECTCPTWTGPYQVGTKTDDCQLGSGEPGSNVWSAAYTPPPRGL